MSKERLEKIEEMVLVDKVYYKYLDGTEGHWGKVYTLSEEDYNYLKEQAERVQELELEVNDWKDEVKKWQRFYEESEESHSETIELLHSTASVIKRYREALEEITKLDVSDGNSREHYQEQAVYMKITALKALEGD